MDETGRPWTFCWSLKGSIFRPAARATTANQRLGCRNCPHSCPHDVLVQHRLVTAREMTVQTHRDSRRGSVTLPLPARTHGRAPFAQALTRLIPRTRALAHDARLGSNAGTCDRAIDGSIRRSAGQIGGLAVSRMATRPCASPRLVSLSVARHHACREVARTERLWSCVALEGLNAGATTGEGHPNRKSKWKPNR